MYKTFINSLRTVWSWSWFTEERQSNHRKGKRLAEQISRSITCFQIGTEEIFSRFSTSVFKRLCNFSGLCAMLCICLAFLSYIKKSAWSSASQKTKCSFSFYTEPPQGWSCPGNALPSLQAGTASRGDGELFFSPVIVQLYGEGGSLGYTPNILCLWWKKPHYIQLKCLLRIVRSLSGSEEGNLNLFFISETH